ncbi:MAG: hypothetical protein V1899_00695, partial [Planctomycetota bacterium]
MIYPQQLPADVLVDTNILLDLVFFEVLPLERRAHLPTAKDVNLFRAFLQSCKRKATTPQILAEIDGHLKRVVKGDRLRLKEIRKKSFGGACLAFSQINVCPLSNLELELIASF